MPWLRACHSIGVSIILLQQSMQSFTLQSSDMFSPKMLTPVRALTAATQPAQAVVHTISHRFAAFLCALSVRPSS